MACGFAAGVGALAVCKQAQTNVKACLSTNIYMFVRVYTGVYIYIYVFVFVYVCTLVYPRMYMYVSICASACLFAHVGIHMLTDIY